MFHSLTSFKLVKQTKNLWDESFSIDAAWGMQPLGTYSKVETDITEKE